MIKVQKPKEMEQSQTTSNDMKFSEIKEETMLLHNKQLLEKLSMAQDEESVISNGNTDRFVSSIGVNGQLNKGKSNLRENGSSTDSINVVGQMNPNDNKSLGSNRSYDIRKNKKRRNIERQSRRDFYKSTERSITTNNKSSHKRRRLKNTNISDNNSELVTNYVDKVVKRNHCYVETNSCSQTITTTNKLENAQYLGLQPSVKFKCYRCGLDNFQSIMTVQLHVASCIGVQALTTVSTGISEQQSINNGHLSTSTPLMSPKHANTLLSEDQASTGTPVNLTNFKISRKVFLCSACGTYYHNYHLYVHMRDVHNKQICLLCLGLFVNSNDLFNHLCATHSINCATYDDAEQVKSFYQTPFYITCCTCNAIFTDKDNFGQHTCSISDASLKASNYFCSSCFSKNSSHLPVCPKIRKSNISIQENINCFHSSGKTLKLPIKQCRVIKSGGNSMLNLPKKHIAPFTENDDYNLGNAAQFCHVALQDENEKIVLNTTAGKNLVNRRKHNKNNSVASNSSDTNNLEYNSKKNRNCENLSSASIDLKNNLNHDHTVDDNHGSRCTVKNFEIITNSSKEHEVEDQMVDNEIPHISLEIPGSVNREQKGENRSVDEDTFTKGEKINSSDSETEKIEEQSDDGDIHSRRLSIKYKIDSMIVENINKILECEINKMINENIDANSSNLKAQAGNKIKTADVDNDVFRQSIIENSNSHLHNSFCRFNNVEKCESTSRKNKITNTEMHQASENNKCSSEAVSNEQYLLDGNENYTDENNLSDSSVEQNSDSSLSSLPNNLKNNGFHKNYSFNEAKMRLNAVFTSESTSKEQKRESVKQKQRIVDVDDQFNQSKSLNKKKYIYDDVTSSVKKHNNYCTDRALQTEIKSTQCHQTAATQVFQEFSESRCSSEHIVSKKYHIKTEPLENSPGNNLEKLNYDLHISDDEDVGSNNSFEEDQLVMKEEDMQPKETLDEKTDDTCENDISLNSDGENASEPLISVALPLNNSVCDLSAESLIKECIRTTSSSCLICYNAVYITINAFQLIDHLLTKHSYVPTQEESTSEQVVTKLEGAKQEMRNLYINSEEQCNTFRCFQCQFGDFALLKELQQHKKKMHIKANFTCGICRYNFVNYCELICHLCPGVLSYGMQRHLLRFRCRLCDQHWDKILSCFRLMVHVRKVHHTCDICLQRNSNQPNLLSHMSKHKLMHVCYKCNISYRSKNDISKHLFWKHGTESVLCKRCLQKKWPHAYHFCVPASNYTCEECSCVFSKPVALTVHKRLHTEEFPFPCANCDKQFISKNLLAKHIRNVHDPVSNQTSSENNGLNGSAENHMKTDKNEQPNDQHDTNIKTKKMVEKLGADNEKPLLDDLPPLNLSSDSEEDESVDVTEITKPIVSKQAEDIENVATIVPVIAENGLVLNTVNEADYLTDKKKTEKRLQVIRYLMFEHSYCLSDSVFSADDKLLFMNEWLQEEVCRKLSSTEPEPEVETLNKFVQNEPDVEPLNEFVQNDPVISSPQAVSQELLPAPHLENDKYEFKIEDLKTVCLQEEVKCDSPNEEVQRVLKHDCLQTEVKDNQASSSNSSSSDEGDSDTSSSSSSSSSCGSNCSCSSSSTPRSDCSTTPEKKRNKVSHSKSHHLSLHDRYQKKTEIFKPDSELSMKLSESEAVTSSIPFSKIAESDLDTDLSSTGEDFYDEQFIYKSLLNIPVEKSAATVTNAPSFCDQITPSMIQSYSMNNTTLLNHETKSGNNSSFYSSKINKKSKRRREERRRRKEKRRMKILECPKIKIVRSSTGNGTSTISRVVAVDSINNHSSNPIHNQESPIKTNTATANLSIDHSRLSKRKRVKNKFYGYSSSGDESAATQSDVSVVAVKKKRPVSHGSTGKSRKNETRNGKTSMMRNRWPTLPTAAYCSSNNGQEYEGNKSTKGSIGNAQRNKPSTSNSQDWFSKLKNEQAPAATPPIFTSSDSEDSDEKRHTLVINLTNSSRIPRNHSLPLKVNGMNQQIPETVKSNNKLVVPPLVLKKPKEKLYCYCRCPYDEVSEMIACDGPHCKIEWFHFECVGIMVPPKGKWFCPTCRKSTLADSLQSDVHHNSFLSPNSVMCQPPHISSYFTH